MYWLRLKYSTLTFQFSLFFSFWYNKTKKNLSKLFFHKNNMDKFTFINLLDLTMVSLNFNVVSTSFDNQNEKKSYYNSSEQNMPQII